MPQKQKIRSMFDNIASEYDLFNHLTSLGIDRTWRRRAMKEIVPFVGPTGCVLDLACGTGDFAIQIAKTLSGRKVGNFRVYGVDLSEGMLEQMDLKVRSESLHDRIRIQPGDGENLLYDDGSFDVVTIAFGIRNFENREKGLREMLRVLRPGGKLVILELSLPSNPIARWFYNLYFLHIMPLIGGKLSGDRDAYRYLPSSVQNFPGKEEFTSTISECGFTQVRHKAFTLGVCRMYTGVKGE